MIFALRFSSGIVGLFVALALIGASTGPRETDRALEGLIGPVRQVTTVSGQSTTIAVYDREGKLLKTVRRVAPPEMNRTLKSRSRNWSISIQKESACAG